MARKDGSPLPAVDEQEPCLKGAAWSIIDCGCCTLSFTAGDPELLGLVGHLVIKVRRRARGKRHRRLWAAFKSFIGLGVDFVLTYDLRYQHQPGPGLMKDLVRFQREHSAHLARQVKSVTFLVKDTFFLAAAKRLLGTLGVLIHTSTPSCPFSVCHSEATAQEFFQQSLGQPTLHQSKCARTDGLAANLPQFCSCPPAGEFEAKNQLTSFLSLVDVQKASTSPTHEDGSSAPTSLALLSSSGDAKPTRGELDLSNANSQPSFTSTESPSFHTLPNGDVRVWQSTPDVMQPIFTGAMLRPPFFTLKFLCPTDALEQILGAHFHMGELLSDAEVESHSQRSIKVAAALQAGANETSDSCLDSACFFPHFHR